MTQDTHRPYRVIVGTFALDQHEVAALLIASILKDAGIEVIYLGRFNMPEDLALVALQEDADVIGISCHSWEYLELAPALVEQLETSGSRARVVLGGSIITDGDSEQMREAGVHAVVHSASSEDDVVAAISDAALAARSNQRPTTDPVTHPG